MVSEQEP